MTTLQCAFGAAFMFVAVLFLFLSLAKIGDDHED